MFAELLKLVANLLIFITIRYAIQTDDDVDAARCRALGGRREFGDDNLVCGNILDAAGTFKEEVMMLARVRIEVEAGGIDNDLAQETGGDELMQRVVVASDTSMFAASASSCSLSAVTCRSPFSNSNLANARRWRVGRRSARRRRSITRLNGLSVIIFAIWPRLPISAIISTRHRTDCTRYGQAAAKMHQNAAGLPRGELIPSVAGENATSCCTLGTKPLR